MYRKQFNIGEKLLIIKNKILKKHISNLFRLFKSKKCVYAFLLFVFAFIVASIYLKHERVQNDAIDMLNQRMAKLEIQNKSSNTANSIVEYSVGGYNYLAIGNSITIHDQTSYWWSTCGMAASKVEKDYVHVFTKKLSDKFGNVRYYAFNFYEWEALSHDRAETYALLEPYLSNRIDLISIQLSENVSSLETFESDYVELINYIKRKCPKAEILIIDDFWDAKDKHFIKKKIALNLDLKYADLSLVKNDNSYKCGVGTTVYDALGNPHIVEHTGVAKHPGDKGMRQIADACYNALFDN